MEYIVVGLGNPGEEYEDTRHNVGRMAVELLSKAWGTSDWREDKKLRAKISHGTFNGQNVTLVLPNNYMNRSGTSVSPLIKKNKQVERLIVVHDDIDLGINNIKIVFNRGDGGHKGVESIHRSIKSKAYTRVRIGVLPTTPTGKLRKPKGEKKIYDFILKKLSKKDLTTLKKVAKCATGAVESIIADGRAKAMCKYNTVVKKKKSKRK